LSWTILLFATGRFGFVGDKDHREVPAADVGPLSVGLLRIVDLKKVLRQLFVSDPHRNVEYL